MCHQGFVILVIMTIAQTVFYCSDVSNRPLLASRKLKTTMPFLATQAAEKFDP